MSLPLAGRVAVVTGAGVRLGRAMAEALAADGASVVVHVGHNVEAGRDVVAGIEARGGRATCVQADLTDPEALEAFAAEGALKLGVPDIVVLSAANFVRAKLAETDAATWDQVFNLNLRAPMLLADRLGRRMAAGNGGAVVLIGDNAGIVPWPSHAAHSLAKGALALVGLPILAMDLAPKVRVNLIAPGPVLFPEDYPEPARQTAIASTLLKRQGHPDDVVAALRYLLGPGSYVTGAVLPVDGGRHVLGVPSARLTREGRDEP